MAVGVLLTLYYIVRVEFDGLGWFGVRGFQMAPWFDVQSTSAGVFGVMAGFLATVLVSLVTKPDPRGGSFLKNIRFRRETDPT